MFEAIVRERLVELLSPKFDDSREMLKSDFSRKSAELASRGVLHSSGTLTAFHDAAVKQLECRVSAVVDSIKKVISARGIPYSSDLAQNIKEELNYFVPLSLWELPQSYPDIVGLDLKWKNELIIDLRERRERVMKKATGELNLFIDELKTNSKNRTVAASTDDAPYSHILLLDEQKKLLLEFVKAEHAVLPEERWKFVIVQKTGLCSILHKGLPQGFRANISDVESLWEAGLLRQGMSGDSYNFSITPLGFMYAQWLVKSIGEPTKRISEEIREYMASEPFKNRYSNAYAKWSQAEATLWGEGSADHFTTIGHLLREALQEFADVLVNRYQLANVSPDKTKTVDRMRAVLNSCQEKLGTTVKPFLEALLTYWGTLLDLIQRQEHGAQKEGKPLEWDDARRVVFQTAVVMFEIDRSLTHMK